MKDVLLELPHLLALVLSMTLLGLGALLLRQAGTDCGTLCVFATPAESAMTGAALLVVGLFNLSSALRIR